MIKLSKKFGSFFIFKIMTSTSFNHFLANLSNTPIKVIDAAINLEHYVPIDLSAQNEALKSLEISSSKAWEDYMTYFLQQKKAKVAYGGYLEKRNLYDRSDYFKDQSVKSKRNIHLGIDLWCEVNTPVLAVLDGEIHSFKNNTNYGDYGPTIIIKHCIQDQTFYSLYGHLSKTSITNISIGQHIKQGALIGYLGSAAVNGDYAPHLHFQLMKDLQNKFGDYPGVSSATNIDYYKDNCPDPNLLLKLPILKKKF